MTMPSWQDPANGTMVRCALWLVQVVGKGHVFTKNELREAFPGVAQSDRRMRDLRDWGWTILSSKEDASLSQEQQRFAQQGIAVWDPVARRKAERDKGVTAREREAILARDDYLCTVCGISGGEEYPDAPAQTAVLAVSRRSVVLPGGREETGLVTECKRCRAGLGSKVRDATKVVRAVDGLTTEDRASLLRWLEVGRREASTAEKIWSQCMRLPSGAREEVRNALRRHGA
ncbi:hypothetical protein [Promicromonospora sp. NPDC060271]|uniref:hypothetical protein n=1 Tax=Promicromonospora sp. NPDC060271 TaxID=3347089 RepID=UPI003654EED4